MSEYKNISKQVVSSYIFHIILIIINLFFFLTMTRGLTKEEYGVVSILFITIALSTSILNLGIPDYIIKHLSSLKEKIKVKVISEIFSFEIFFVIFLFLVSLILFKPLINFFNLFLYQFAIISSLFIIIITPPKIFLTSYLTSKQKIVSANFVTLLSGLWMLIIIFMGLFYKKINITLLFFIRGGIIFIIFIGLFLILKIKDKVRLVIPKKNTIKKALIFSLPLLPLFVSEYIITAVDRYIISFFHGMASVGSYTYFYSLLLFIFGFAVIPIETLFSYSARDYKKNKQKSNFFFNAGTKYALMLLIPALVGLFILGKEIITLISGPTYLNDLYILPFLILFPVIECCCVPYRKAIMLKGNTKKLFQIYMVGALLNIILNIILIPKLNIVGAAIATIISYTILLLLLYKEGKTSISWNNKFIKLQNILISSFIMGIILYFFNPQIAWTKILTILLGATIYFILLFITKTFVKEEIGLVKSIIFRKNKNIQEDLIE